MASTAIQTLAEYATGLQSEDIPDDVQRRARVCLADAIACAAFGARFPWSAAIRDHALAVCGTGPCRLPHLDLAPMPTVTAAMLGGAFAHAFELDSLRKPGAGVHPGATVALPALAVAQETGAAPADLLRAIVAGIEVMFRIGNATLHSAEGRGFHAPGFTGPFGAAVAASVLYGLSADEAASAMGIAASCGGGVLAFAAGGGGGMVKRLHMGRAAAAGVDAANLARRGFEGPISAIEGRFGILEAYCPEADPSRLTEALGATFETRSICIKRYACHVTAQAPVELLRDLMAEHRFAAEEIERMTLGVASKIRSHHSTARPVDVAGAQYSVPFSVAAAAFEDPEDPLAFERAVSRPDCATLAERIELRPFEALDCKWGVEMTVRLVSGRRIEGNREAFLGTPERPMTDAAFADKFRSLTGANLAVGDMPIASWVEPIRPA